MAQSQQQQPSSLRLPLRRHCCRPSLSPPMRERYPLFLLQLLSVYSTGRCPFQGHDLQR